jgi:hypothetical protein
MNELLVAFWTFLIFISLAWYGVLVFYIGVKGGREIGTMIIRLQKDEKGGSTPSSDSPEK